MFWLSFLLPDLVVWAVRQEFKNRHTDLDLPLIGGYTSGFV